MSGNRLRPVFSPAEPFPLIDPASFTKTEAIAHAKACDEWLGFEIQKIEKRLSAAGCRKRAPTASGKMQQLWIDLEPQDLLTPYLEIRWFLENLHPQAGQTVVDLGAGYGRMGFVMARCYPACRFIGYEYVGERVEETRRCLSRFGAGNARMEHADLSASGFTPEVADIYFLYDFGTPKAIEKVLFDLRRIAATRPIALISRGRHSRYIIESSHPWLVKANPLATESRASIYRPSFSYGSSVSEISGVSGNSSTESCAESS